MKNEEMSLKTKRRLGEALKKRMEKTDFRKITVSDLLKDCDITRSTFYYYFKDIYDLLEWTLDTEALELLNKCNETYTWEEGILLFMQYCEKNSKMCLSLINSVGRSTLERMFYKDSYALIKRAIDLHCTDINCKEEEREFTIEFFVRGYAGCLISWFERGMKESPEEVVEILKHTVIGGIRDALTRSVDYARKEA